MPRLVPWFLLIYILCIGLPYVLSKVHLNQAGMLNDIHICVVCIIFCSFISPDHAAATNICDGVLLNIFGQFSCLAHTCSIQRGIDPPSLQKSVFVIIGLSMTCNQSSDFFHLSTFYPSLFDGSVDLF